MRSLAVGAYASAYALAGATAASKKAGTWMWIAFGLGLAVQLLYAAFMLLATPMIREAAEQAAAGGM